MRPEIMREQSRRKSFVYFVDSLDRSPVERRSNPNRIGDDFHAFESIELRN
jgi:hypothetical protein